MKALRLLLAAFLCFSVQLQAFGFACTHLEWLGFDGVWTTSKSAAANSFVGIGKATDCPAGQPYSLYWQSVDGLGADNDGTFTHTNAYCGSGYVVSNNVAYGMSVRNATGSCVCSPPLIEVNGACVDKCADQGGKPFGGGGSHMFVLPVNSGIVDTLCDTGASSGGGCTIKGTGQMAANDGGLGFSWVNNPSYTGTSCPAGLVAVNTGPPAGSTTTAIPQTPPGKCSGTFNGQTVYHECASLSTPAATTSKSVATSNPDGSTTTSTITRTETVSCADGVCTSRFVDTTRVSNVPVGGGAPTSTVTASNSDGTATQADYCKDNPSSAACKDSKKSTFSGSCNAAFSCDGDAATCAIATAANKSLCLEEKNATEDSVLKQAGIDAIASSSSGTSTSIVNFTAGDINQSNPFSSTCPPDKVLAMHGFSVTLPLSQACGALQAMGAVLVAVSLLVAARIVGGA